MQSGAGPKSMVVDLTSTYAYVAHASDGKISAFEISNGMLVPIVGSPFDPPAGISGAEGMAVTP